MPDRSETFSDRSSARLSARLSASRSQRDPRAIRRTSSARASARRRSSRPGETPSRGRPRPGLASFKGNTKPQSSASDRVELTPAYPVQRLRGRSSHGVAALEAEKTTACFRDVFSSRRSRETTPAARIGRESRAMSERKSTRVKTVAKALKRVDEDTRRQVRRDAGSRPAPDAHFFSRPARHR